MEADSPMQLEGEPNLRKMAKRVENLFKFEHFYDQMKLNPEKRLVITRLLYVTASVRVVKLKRAMLDRGSSLNIISLVVLDAVDIPWDRITRQTI